MAAPLTVKYFIGARHFPFLFQRFYKTQSNENKMQTWNKVCSWGWNSTCCNNEPRVETALLGDDDLNCTVIYPPILSGAKTVQSGELLCCVAGQTERSQPDFWHQQWMATTLLTFLLEVRIIHREICGKLCWSSACYSIQMPRITTKSYNLDQ